MVCIYVVVCNHTLLAKPLLHLLDFGILEEDSTSIE